MAAEIKKVYNKGVYYKGKYKSRINGKHTVAYNTWINMLQRCYDEKLHKRNPSYSNCYVVDDWLDFQKFNEWFDLNYIENYQLDKDLLFPGNKIYGPDTCCFLPKEINVTLIKPLNERLYPTGVYKRYNKFVVRVKENKKSKIVGSFCNIQDAKIAYTVAKQKQLDTLVQKYENTISTSAQQALLNYSSYNN